MKSLYLLVVALGMVCLLSSCGKDKKPNYIEMSPQELYKIVSMEPVDIEKEEPSDRPDGLPICNV